MTGERFRLMDAAGADGTAGGGAAPATPAAGGAPGGAAPAANGATAGSPDAKGAGAPAGSLLSQAQGEHDWLPEKFRVFGEDKKLDLTASAKKLAAEGYAPLEKRFSVGDVPPKSPEDYKFETLPEGVTLDALQKDEKFGEFIKAAHAKGLTNAQAEFVLNEWFTRAQQMAESQQAATVEAAQEALRQVWKDDDALKANLKHAFKAASAVAQKAGVSIDDVESAGLGNNPVFLRIMAALGPEVGETLGGGLPNDAKSSSGADDINALQAKLIDPKFDRDPARASWQRKVNDFYARLPGAGQAIY